MAQTHALARACEVELALEPTPSVLVHGDSSALASLARNLVDNAVRHAPRGSRVDVRVGVSDGTVLLQVDDAGPGIAPADRERVFDRFVRRTQGAGLHRFGRRVAG